MTGKVGRNDPCPCGSGRKYKKCCQESFDEKDFHYRRWRWQVKLIRGARNSGILRYKQRASLGHVGYIFSGTAKH